MQQKKLFWERANPHALDFYHLVLFNKTFECISSVIKYLHVSNKYTIIHVP